MKQLYHHPEAPSALRSQSEVPTRTTQTTVVFGLVWPSWHPLGHEVPHLGEGSLGVGPRPHDFSARSRDCDTIKIKDFDETKSSQDLT